jgi:ATP-dependent RNA helicase RhlE
MFSATMTEDIEDIIAKFFISTVKVSVALSGTPLENITQSSYAVPNFYTKANLLVQLLKEVATFKKVLVFVANKRSADRLFEELQELYNDEICVIHSNKTQNYRMRSIKQFDEGINRVLVTTDVMARGLDLNEITHVINFDTPHFPENYMHRIGRTGRAEKKGESLLFYTEKEIAYKNAIEALMNMEIKQIPFPREVEIATRLTPEEQPQTKEPNNPHKQSNEEERGASFHEKAEKNKKTNERGSYKRIIKAKYKKPKTRGDKNYNKSKRRK